MSERKREREREREERSKWVEMEREETDSKLIRIQNLAPLRYVDDDGQETEGMH